MNKTHKSFAEWPKGTLCLGDTVTTDSHYSEKEALSVCRILEREGFGGNGKVFPIKTWVEPIEK
jgi:hypothetical protein